MRLREDGDVPAGEAFVVPRHEQDLLRKPGQAANGREFAGLAPARHNIVRRARWSGDPAQCLSLYARMPCFTSLTAFFGPPVPLTLNSFPLCLLYETKNA